MSCDASGKTVPPAHGRLDRAAAIGRRGLGNLACILALAAILMLTAAQSRGHSGFPIDIVSGRAPQAVKANGQVRLLYELHIENYASLPIDLTRIEIRSETGTLLANYDGDALSNMVAPVEKLSLSSSPTEAKGNRKILDGHAAVVFIDLSFGPDIATPKELHHRLSISVARTNKPNYEDTVDAIVTTLPGTALVLASAPLRGESWVAFNALGAEDHRRSLNAFDGRERIPQRFAIDWTRLGPDGRLFKGKGASNSDYYSYGSEVLAVADGRISDVKDGLPENGGQTNRDARAITLDNVLGNYVVLDCGQSRFATYAHLKPGSIKMKVGDNIRAGQALGFLGNSGNSDAPHLHFQMTDGNAPLGSEGIPYAIQSFIQSAVLPKDSGSLDSGGSWRPSDADRSVTRHDEFPVDGAVVTLP
jgi:murein DD-endopeptidase